MLIGFILNPIAGMGGRVGLKGTDHVIDEALNRGAHPVAIKKAETALNTLIDHFSECLDEILWITCEGSMGKNALINARIKEERIKTVFTPKSQELGNTSSDDTKAACQKMIDEQVSLIVFCGGDGTARDIVSIVGNTIPILGIPSGVKMHSGVFAITSHAAGEMIARFIKGELQTGEAEIMDLDETLYRKGTWKVRLYDTAKGIIEPSYIQVGKASFAQIDDSEIKDDIADHIEEEMNKNNDFLFLMGSGGTINYVADKIGINNTILGIDAVFKKKSVAIDVNEKDLLSLLEKYEKVKIILSPIGAQGFIFGRGNLQLSPSIIRKVGIDNIIIISTPSKLKATPIIRVDTGDVDLDNAFVDYEMMMVVIGYRTSRVVRIESV